MNPWQGEQQKRREHEGCPADCGKGKEVGQSHDRGGRIHFVWSQKHPRRWSAGRLRGWGGSLRLRKAEVLPLLPDAEFLQFAVGGMAVALAVQFLILVCVRQVKAIVVIR